MATSTKKTATTKRSSSTKTAKKPATRKTTKPSSTTKPSIKRASTPKRKRRPMHPELRTALALLALFLLTLALFPLLQWAAQHPIEAINDTPPIILEKPTIPSQETEISPKNTF